MSDRPDHYRVLGVDRNADPAQIRHTYVHLIKANHPDSRPRSRLPSERLHLLRQAYDCLRDPERRAAYDLALLAREREHDRHVRRIRHKLRSFDQPFHADRTRYARKRSRRWQSAMVVAASGTAMLTLAALLLS